MANNSPTLVMASLSDDQLKKSIDSLVTHVDEAMKKMVQSTNNAVGEMEAKLKSLGNLKIDSNGSADSGASKRAKAQNAETAALEKSNQAAKEKTMTLDQQASAINTAIQSERKYTEEIRKQAAAIRATKEWQEKGWVMIGDNRFFDRDRANATKRERENMLTLEERLVQLQQQEAQEALVAAEAKRKQAQAAKEAAQADSQTKTLYNYDYTKSVARARQIGATNTQEVNYLKTQIADLLGIQEREVQMINIEKASYGELSSYIKQLQSAYQKLGGDIASRHGKDIADELQRAQRELQKYQAQMSRPVDLKSAMGLSEKTLDDIAYKMRQLASYRSGLDVNTRKNEIFQVNQEYDRLKKKMDEVMQKNSNMIASNTALGRSWNYMKNRLAFYFTVGASTQFVKNLIEVRSQYEMNERALGILIDSAERGTQIFNELSQMALVSPYTLIELSTAAKQLTAYDVAAKDVVDTTRRLADMAAAVGIPIERLTYALGQIKAYGYLNSRDARMFANAGIPLVKQLSEYYTELEGRLVSTADVYDRIKKKAIDYSDVMSVINKMTDEGGKFFDFQAKMADTLKVQLANLTLAWNNMLNDIGSSNQWVLTGGINLLKDVFLNWKKINTILNDVIIVVGAMKGAQLLLNLAIGKGTQATITQIAANQNSVATDYEGVLSKENLTKAQIKYMIAVSKGNKALIEQAANMKLLTQREAEAAASAGKLKNIGRIFGYGIVSGVQGATKAIQGFVASLSAVAPMLLGALALGAIVDLFQTIYDRSKAISELNSAIAKNAKESAESIKETLDSLNSTFKTNGVSDATQLKTEDQEKAWNLLREEIELSTASANHFIEALLQEDNMGERVNKAKELLVSIQRVHEIMSLWHDDAIEVTDDFKVLGIGADGLSEDLSDFQKWLNASSDSVENLDELSSGLGGTWREILSYVYDFSDILAYIGVGSAHPTGWLKNIGDFLGLDFLDPEKAKLVDSYNEVMKEIKPLSESLQREIIKSGITEASEAKEVVSKTISSIAAEKQWSEEKTLYARLLIEKEWSESSNKIFRDAVSDRQTAWDAWLKFLTTRHKTEFSNMGNEEISLESWTQDKRKKLYEETFQKFKEYNVLAANQIEDKVNDLSQLQLHIKVYYDEQNQPSWLEKDFKNRLPNSTLNVKEYKSVTDLISGEQKALKDANEETKRLRNAGVSELDEHFLDVKNRARQAAEALHAYNAELEETKGSKRSGTKKDPLGDALAKEVQLVNEIQKRYKEYQQIGVSAQDAIRLATEEYGNTLKRTGATLKKFGISTKTGEELAGMDIRQVRDYYKSLLDMAKSAGNAKGIEAVEKALANINVEITKSDYSKITKGLNSELDKLKEEYELAVELDANPELGGMFADFMGINMDELPKTFQEATKKAQEYIDKVFQENGRTDRIDIASMLDKESFDKWVKDSGLKMDSELVKSVEAFRQYLHKVQVDETKKQIDEWSKLLEKYAEYEYKRKQILDTYEREMDVARKRNADKAIRDAIERRKNEQLAELDFNEFMKTPEWIVATGDLAGMSKQAIGMLIEEIEKYKKTARNLSPKQIHNLNKALKKLYKEQRKNNPFRAISNMLEEARERAETFDEEIENVQNEIQDLTFQKSAELAAGIVNEDTDKRLKGAIERLKELKKKKDEVGKPNASDWVQSINEWVAAVKTAVSVFDDLAKAIGGVKGNSDVDKVFSILEKGGQGAAIGAQIGQGYGAIIGAVAGVATGIISTFADQWSGNASITEAIQDSEHEVRKLELAYIDLEHAVNEAYGEAEIGAKQAVIANKKLQLAELQRQLALEKSRSSKNRDEERIIEIQKQIKELEYEISDATKDIVNDLLGISSVGDFAENLVSQMIEAFKNGEDYMEKFEESFDDMIDNMIMKAIVSRVIGDRIKQILDYLDSKIKSDSQGLYDEKAELEQERDALKESFESLEKNPVKKDMFGEIIRMYKDKLRDLDNRIEEINRQISDAGSQSITPELTEDVRDMVSGMKDNVREEFLALMDAFGITYGQSSSGKDLSQLQQGIQGITEVTANALEAYMNGVSQQVYLHSELLTQIRDAIMCTDSDIQLGVQGQMLLQLQQSYQVQMSIQGILEGVLVPSGRAFAVELMS